MRFRERFRRTTIVASSFHRTIQVDHDLDAWEDRLVLRITNAGQRDVTVTHYWFAKQGESGDPVGGWYALEPAVTIGAHGGLHDLDLSFAQAMEHRLGPRPFQGQLEVWFRLSTDEVVRFRPFTHQGHAHAGRSRARQREPESG